MEVVVFNEDNFLHPVFSSFPPPFPPPSIIAQPELPSSAQSLVKFSELPSSIPGAVE